MRILSHRGWWLRTAEHNTPAAFTRSFSAGYGTETDLRDRDGSLVISHDPARSGALPLGEFLDQHQAHDPSLPLALNIKADGLAPLLAAQLRTHPLADYFCFDMSVPETRRYAAAGLRFFTRQSEFEPAPAFLDQAEGVWIDAFEREWIDHALIAAHLAAGRRVCLVSPELHGRDPHAFWRLLRTFPLLSSSSLLICTDLVDQTSTQLKTS
jgi:glycerophosphoryl diester phosphodiesterase